MYPKIIGVIGSLRIVGFKADDTIYEHNTSIPLLHSSNDLSAVVTRPLFSLIAVGAFALGFYRDFCRAQKDN